MTDDQKAQKSAPSDELSLSAIMSSQGLEVLHPGDRDARAGEIVDIEAFHPFAPLAFGIDETLGPTHNGTKIARLEQRRQEMARRLQDLAVEAVGVVDADETSAADLAEAGARGVILLNRAQLRELRKSLTAKSGPSDVAQWVLKYRARPPRAP